MIKPRNVIKSKFNFLLLFVAFSMFFYSIPVKADSFLSDSISERVTISSGLDESHYYKKHFYWSNLSSSFPELVDNIYYRVYYDLSLDLGFSTTCDLNTLTLTLEVSDESEVDRLNYVLFHNTESVEVSNQTTSFNSSGFFIVKPDSNYSLDNFRSSLSFSITDLPSYSNINYDIYSVLTLKNIVPLTRSEQEIYEEGFNAGYDDGSQFGYSSGYFVGYDSGYDSGNLDGFQEGSEAGYNSGYDIGYSEGVDSGYSDGYESGKVAGESEGYNSGYDEGFFDGQSSVNTDQFYQKGYDDGIGSIDTDQYYQDGFQAGVSSVDTNSFYQAGYEAGLDAGYKEAYDTGYSEGVSFGYSQGYQEALKKAQSDIINNLSNTGTSVGSMFTVTQTINQSKSVLQLSDSNTLLPLTFDFSYGEDYEFDYEREVEYGDREPLYSESSGYADGDFWDDGYLAPDGEYSETGDFDYRYDEETTYNYQFFGKDVDEKYFKELTKKYEKWKGWGYYYMAPTKLFTADPKYYAYKITLYQWNTTYTSNNINWIRNTVGEWSDIMRGESDLGLGFYQGAGGEISYIIKTDNLPVDIYSALLMNFYNDETGTASFNLKSQLQFDIRPFSRNEYAGIMAGIDDLQNDINKNFGDLSDNLTENFQDLQKSMNKEFDDLMNSYDTTVGDQANNELSNSLDNFSSMEDSLFQTATNSLNQFEFFDSSLLFKQGAPLAASLTFVTSLMTSSFQQMGGLSGASGIVLSVLFTVMLIGMALGIYKFYQSRGGKK